MDKYIETILEILILIASFILFFSIVSNILPKLFLKITYSLDDCLGRGIKKFTFPEGRAVLYEPHPRYRKFINKYSLFTNEGYKYLKCLVDKKVKHVKLNVVMFDNRGNVLDFIKISDYPNGNSETESILLHHNTSYVSLQVDQVNDTNVYNTSFQKCSLKNIITYSVLVATAFFIELLVIIDLLTSIFAFFNLQGINFTTPIYNVVFYSLIVGLIAFIRTVRCAKKNDIKVVNNERK